MTLESMPLTTSPHPERAPKARVEGRTMGLHRVCPTSTTVRMTDRSPPPLNLTREHINRSLASMTFVRASFSKSRKTRFPGPGVRLR